MLEATHYRLDSLGIESQWGRNFPHPFRLILGPIQPAIQCVLGFSGVKWPGRGVNHPPHLAPRRAFKACSRANFTAYFFISPKFPNSLHYAGFYIQMHIWNAGCISGLAMCEYKLLLREQSINVRLGNIIWLLITSHSWLLGANKLEANPDNWWH
jgi:hypothetical protein